MCSKILLDQKLKMVMNSDLQKNPAKVIIDLLENYVRIENKLLTHQELNYSNSKKYTESQEALQMFQWEHEEILTHYYQTLHVPNMNTDEVATTQETRMLVSNCFIK